MNGLQICQFIGVAIALLSDVRTAFDFAGIVLTISRRNHFVFGTGGRVVIGCGVAIVQVVRAVVRIAGLLAVVGDQGGGFVVTRSRGLVSGIGGRKLVVGTIFDAAGSRGRGGGLLGLG